MSVKPADKLNYCQRFINIKNIPLNAYFGTASSQFIFIYFPLPGFDETVNLH